MGEKRKEGETLRLMVRGWGLEMTSTRKNATGIRTDNSGIRTIATPLMTVKHSKTKNRAPKADLCFYLPQIYRYKAE